MIVFDKTAVETAIAQKHKCTGPLLPRHVLQTAEADLARYGERSRIKRAKDHAKDCGADPAAWGTPPQTAFLPKHLRIANSVRHLLLIAQRDCVAGSRATQSPCARMIYVPGLLAAALELHDAIEKHKKAELRGNGIVSGQPGGQKDYCS